MQDNLSKITYPNDNAGNLCGWGASENYKFLYYTSLTDAVLNLFSSRLKGYV